MFRIAKQEKHLVSYSVKDTKTGVIERVTMPEDPTPEQKLHAAIFGRDEEYKIVNVGSVDVNNLKDVNDFFYKIVDGLTIGQQLLIERL